MNRGLPLLKLAYTIMMEKLESSTYRGIDYIRLTELPDNQYLPFMKWVNRESVITIQVNGNPLKNCVQYSDYCYWFDNVYLEQENQASTENKQRIIKSYGLAFDN